MISTDKVQLPNQITVRKTVSNQPKSGGTVCRGMTGTVYRGISGIHSRGKGGTV